MKKICAIVFAGCIAATAAAGPQVRKSASATPCALEQRDAVAAYVRRAPAHIGESADLTWKDLGKGQYSDALASNMYDGASNAPVEVSVQECEQTSGLYRVLNPWPSIAGEEDFYLVIDATDPDFVVIPKQVTPIIDEADGETWVASLSAVAVEDYGYDSTDFMEDFGDLNIYMSDGVIYMPAGSGMFMWPDAESGYAEPGEWVMTDEVYAGYLALPGHSYVDEWEPVGTGRMFDGFVCTFVADAAPVEKDVEISKNINKPGVYRLTAPFADLWSASRDLIIDASDAGFVKIMTQSTGIPLQTYGTMYVLSLSSNNYDSLEDFLYDYTEDCNISQTGNRIDIPAKAMRMYFPDYSMSKIFVNDYAVGSYVLLPGSDGVESILPSSSATPEYYNLQGVRVVQPEQGIYIRLHDGNADKVMVK